MGDAVAYDIGGWLHTRLLMSVYTVERENDLELKIFG